MTNLTKIWVGVDVSKKTLDISVYPVLEKDFSVNNDQEGITKLIAKLSKYEIVQLVCEPSGYETLMLQMLMQQKIPCWRVDPNRVKAFIRSEGIRAKTDQGDARMMALFSSQKQKDHTSIALSESGLQLEALSKRRDDIQKTLQAEKTRWHQTIDSFCKKSIKESINFLEQQLSEINKQINDLIDKNDDWQRKAVILQSIPGVGEITANRLIAQVPELGKIDDKKLTALIGVAPYTRQSGAWRGKSFIIGGRAEVRKDLYMAAFSAAHHNPVLKVFYKRLRDAGKPFKVAIIAVIRKLLIIVNAMVRNNKEWNIAS